MRKLFFIVPVLILLTAGCKKEYSNPNAPTEDEVFNSADGMTRLIVGLKQRYAVNTLAVSTVYGAISASGLSTKEVTVLNAGNADLAQLEIGGSNVAPNNGVITGLWTTTNIINSEAQKLIDNSSKIGDMNLRNAVKIYGHLYKAMALGTLATFWEKVPINTGQNTTFNTRTEALQAAVKLLDDASALLQTTTVPASFTSAVGGEIDLKNTLLALSARYNMMLLNNDAALAKASAVDLTKKSVFFYNNINPNPIFRSSLTNNNTYGIKANFGLAGALAPDPADKRAAFHLTKNAQNGSGFFQSDATAIPVYLPGEMLLIQAEAYTRKNDLPNAVLYLNKVLTKKPADDPFGVGADLPAYNGPMTQQAILQEIYRNRLIELYMLGLKLEDSRRFERPGPGTPNAERTRNFYPYPQQERDGNASTPLDPTV
ncbi:MAG: RagB/SusD family nutrient uptake outer membrane protein [Bacteroidota bacterium]|nr:RagB/SusD family nutrient uptake outer membrane protein [Flavisolibacter sp.]MBD0349606.1 RagB/SusD family nutrient uptake outer membrane protein [Flavisolibacter sp.]MBD0376112.1 RagB/SusD family nutrient uptake outer membrane protein [Flavisolibacter sp.]MDQ3845307.1 RagB/SusD family nutrient uptake outer membrane protein [Bacteroidota bacterium]